MAKILVIEDEQDIADLFEAQFKILGHEVVLCGNGQEAISRIQQESFDIFVIDRMLPGASGIEICRFIRNYLETKTHPILMVTALSSPENIVEGLDAGADDYITKPFDLKIFMARFRSLLRRVEVSNSIGQQKGNSVELGRLKIDFDQCTFHIDQQELVLTASEYRILSVLLKNPRKVLSRTELVKSVIGENVHVTERTIDTHIAGIRKKMGDAAFMIETIRGIGYRINDRIED